MANFSIGSSVGNAFLIKSIPIQGNPAEGQILKYNLSSGVLQWNTDIGPEGGNFTQLGDTPSAYTGAANQVVKVNSGATALEFGDVHADNYGKIQLGVNEAVASTMGDTFEFAQGDGISMVLDVANDKLTVSNSGTLVAYNTIKVDGQSDVVASGAEDTLTLEAGYGIEIDTDPGNDNVKLSVKSTHDGDIHGPSVSVDDRLVTFDGTTGKLVQDSGTLISEIDGTVKEHGSVTDTHVAIFHGSSKIIKDGGKTVAEIVAAGAAAAPQGTVSPKSNSGNSSNICVFGNNTGTEIESGVNPSTFATENIGKFDLAGTTEGDTTIDVVGKDDTILFKGGQGIKLKGTNSSSEIEIIALGDGVGDVVKGDNETTSASEIVVWNGNDKIINGGGKTIAQLPSATYVKIVGDTGSRIAGGISDDLQIVGDSSMHVLVSEVDGSTGKATIELRQEAKSKWLVKDENTDTLYVGVPAQNVSIGDQDSAGGETTSPTLLVSRLGTGDATPREAELTVQTKQVIGTTGVMPCTLFVRAERNGDAFVALGDDEHTHGFLAYENNGDYFVMENGAGDIHINGIDAKKLSINGKQKKFKTVFLKDSAQAGQLLTINPEENFGVQISDNPADDDGVTVDTNVFEVNSITKPSQPWPTMTTAQVATMKNTQGGAVFDTSLNRLMINQSNSAAHQTHLDPPVYDQIFVNAHSGNDLADGESPGAAKKTLAEAVSAALSIWINNGNVPVWISLQGGMAYELSTTLTIVRGVLLKSTGGSKAVISYTGSTMGTTLVDVAADQPGQRFEAHGINFMNKHGCCLRIKRSNDVVIRDCGFYQLSWNVQEDTTNSISLTGTWESSALHIGCTTDNTDNWGGVGERPSTLSPTVVDSCYFLRTRSGNDHHTNSTRGSRFGQALIRVDGCGFTWSELTNVTVKNCVAHESPIANWNDGHGYDVCPGFLSLWTGTGGGATVNGHLGTESWNRPTVISQNNTYTVDFSNIGDNRKDHVYEYQQEWAMFRQADDFNYEAPFHIAQTVLISEGDTFNPIWENWTDDTLYINNGQDGVHSRVQCSFLKFVHKREDTSSTNCRTSITNATFRFGSSNSSVTRFESYGLRPGYQTWISTRYVEQGNDNNSKAAASKITAVLSSCSSTGLGSVNDTMDNQDRVNNRMTLVDSNRFIPAKNFHTNIMVSNVGGDGKNNWLSANGEHSWNRPIIGEIARTGNATTKYHFRINLHGAYQGSHGDQYEITCDSSTQFQYRKREYGSTPNWSGSYNIADFHDLSGEGYEDGYRYLDGTADGSAVGGIRIKFTSATCTSGDTWKFSGNYTGFLNIQYGQSDDLYLNGGQLHNVSSLNMEGTPAINMGSNKNAIISSSGDSARLLFTGSNSKVQVQGTGSWIETPWLNMPGGNDYIHVDGGNRQLHAATEEDRKPAISTVATIGATNYAIWQKNGNSIAALDRGEPVKAMLGAGFNTDHATSPMNEVHHMNGSYGDSPYFAGIVGGDMAGSNTWGYGWIIIIGYCQALVLGGDNSTSYSHDLEPYDGHLRVPTSGSTNYHTVGYSMQRSMSSSATLRNIWLMGPATTSVVT